MNKTRDISQKDAPWTRGETLLLVGILMVLFYWIGCMLGCAQNPQPAEAKIEGGTASVSQSREDIRPSETRERKVRIVITGLPAGSVVVPIKENK